MGVLADGAWRTLPAGVQRLEAENAWLWTERDRLAGEVARLTSMVGRLRAQLDEARRAAKRQAAPFTKGRPVLRPRRPGRKPGPGYGVKARRPVPERVDRVIAVPAPRVCPDCGGPVVVERVACQSQEDLPPAVTGITRFEVALGRCQRCRRRVRGSRHPEQTSDALGAAGVGVGPRAVALVAWLSKGLGLPAGKVSRLLSQLGMTLSASGVQQAVARAARVCQPTYQALERGVRASPVVAPDETGWRVAGRRAWLWAFVGDRVVVYRIAAGRGYADAAQVLGEDYAGVLERDGWAPYRRFTRARHQSCLAHLLRRCRELIDDADRGQARTPHAVRRILTHALAVRADRDTGALTAAEATAKAEQFGGAVDRLITGRSVHPPNRRLLNHLARERAHLFTFLTVRGVQATNWRAEHAIRPAVVTRKVWGGNRTWSGAGTWQTLASVLATATAQQRDPVAILVPLLRAPTPRIADLAIPSQTLDPAAPSARSP
jgi:transposase